MGPNAVGAAMLIAVAYVWSFGTSSALDLDMTVQTKCVMEEINANVIVVGDYAGIRKDDLLTPVELDVKVEDPSGRSIYFQPRQTRGQFAFTTKTPGDYKACFTARDAHTATHTKIRLDWKTGVAATDWDAIAKKENLDAMATELRRLEESLKEVHEEMLYLRKREEDMRDLNEATNNRVAFYSIASLVICIALAAWQLWHLQDFFHRKKLL